MILNKNLTFSEAQAVTATAISENVIQWEAVETVPRESGPIDRNLGKGIPIPILLQVVEDFATLTSLTISLETADNAALSSGSVVLATTVAIPAASLVQGFKPGLEWLPDAVMKEYLGFRYTVGGANATAGQVWAALATETS